MSPITRRLLVGAVAVGATAALGMGLASAQTESPPTTQSPPPTTETPAPDPDRKNCHGRDGGDRDNGDNGDGGTAPSPDAGSPSV